MYWKPVLLLAIISLLVLATPPAAALMVDVPFTELVSGADSVVVGTVLSVESRWNEDQTLIRTYATVSVEHNVAKTPVDDTIMIVVDGGTVDGITLWVSDSPILVPDRKVGVMLRSDDAAGLYTPYGQAQGVYELQDDTLTSTVLSAGRRPDRTKIGGGSTPDQFVRAVRMAQAGIEPLFDTEIPKPVGAAEYSPGLLSSDGFTTSTASAGTSATMTITGSGFGEKESRESLADVVFFFIGAGNGLYWPIYATGWLPTSDWQDVNANSIISWSDTEVVTHVPTGIAWRGFLYPGSASSGPVWVLTDDGEECGPYSLSVPFGWLKMVHPVPIRWAGDSPVVEYYVNPPPISGALAAVQSAADTWSAVPDASFSFIYADTTEATELSFNGKNEIIWTDFGESTILGQARIWSTDNGEILEADMRFNTQFSWSTDPGSGEIDIETVALHEFGHWVGLTDLYGNLDGYPSDTGKVMYGFGSPGITKRNLHTGDREGIVYIYPGDPSPPDEYTVTFCVRVGEGSIAATADGEPVGCGAAVGEGAEVVFTATPAAGWEVADWYVDDIALGISAATYTIGSLEADVTVEVAFEEIPPDEHTVTFCVRAGEGSIAATADGEPVGSGDAVGEGAKVVFTATPAAGWEVADWYVDDIALGISAATYTIETLEADVTVEVAFEEMPPDEYTVTFCVRAGEGSIAATADGEPVGSGAAVGEGAAVVFTATPAAGWEVADWYVDDIALGISAATYTIGSLEADVTVEVAFEEIPPDEHTVTFCVRAGEGSIAATADGEPVGSGAAVGEGAEVVFTATPAAGWEVADWYLNDAALDLSAATYTIGSLEADVTVEVAFEEIPPDEHTVTFCVRAGEGSIAATADGEPVGSGDTVGEGAEVVFIATPAAGWEVADWYLNDAALDLSAATYTIGSLEADVTVEVAFEEIPPDEYTVTFCVRSGEGSIAATADGEPVGCGDAVGEGAEVVFTATPAAGWEVADWYLNDAALDLSAATYTIGSLEADVTVEVAFEEIPPDEHTVTFSVRAGEGSIAATADGEPVGCGAAVGEGAEVVFTATPAAGWEVADWYLNNESLNRTDETYTIGSLEADVTVEVAFEESVTAKHGVFRNGQWIFAVDEHWTPTPVEERPHFGQAGDIPIIPDGKPVVFRNGQWIFALDEHWTPTPVEERPHFGQAGDIPIILEGKPGVFRNGQWIFAVDEHWTPTPVEERPHFGQAGDIPIILEGKPGVFRNGQWIFAVDEHWTPTPAEERPHFGQAGDRPVMSITI